MTLLCTDTVHSRSDIFSTICLLILSFDKELLYISLLFECMQHIINNNVLEWHSRNVIFAKISQACFYERHFHDFTTLHNWPGRRISKKRWNNDHCFFLK